jgi:hypothetical protein
MSHIVIALLALGELLAMSGCSASTYPPPDPAAAPPAPTYYQDVEPILHTRCARCHQPNNLGPFSLLTADEVAPMAGRIASAVAQKIMPPMPAAQHVDGCPDIDDPRVMPDAERDIIARWARGGATLGDARPPRAAPSGDGPLGPPTNTFESPLTYEAPSTGDDDYRCFVIDPVISAPIGVSAVSAQPGNAQIVHHATVYLVPPEGAADVQKLDQDDPRAGYSCFGGVGSDKAYAAGGWVPGVAATPPPRAGLGGWLLPNWLMVLQVHYNFANGRGTDRSSVTAWKSPVPIVEEPGGLLLGDWGIVIPAGQKSVVRHVTGQIVSATTPPQLGQAPEGLIYAAWAHEHLLGKSFRMDLVREDGTAQCLLSIPSWTFHWQAIYPFKSPVKATPGEQVRVTCEWDNSPENQPVVDGRRQAPREVHYGESTADEMCIGTLAVMKP